MNVLIAGATGVIGRQLVPMLIDAGDDVTVLARADRSEAPPGVRLVRAGAFDREAVSAAVRQVDPEAIVDLRTAIPRQLDPRRFEEEMALTNRLRTEATSILTHACDPRTRFISQGLAFAYRPSGTTPAKENDVLWTDGPRPFRPSVRALGELERLTAEVGGLTLRFGHLYGPGTSFAHDGAFIQQLMSRRAPIVGHGDSVFSFIHTADAASAVVVALHRSVRGVLNVVDDHPTPVREWLPELARLVGAPPPRRVPVALARLAAGSWGVAYMDRLRGADNRRARQVLDWRPRFSSWRDGFTSDLSDTPQPATASA